MHRLLIVDDEPHVVNWLVELFQNQPDMNLEVLRANTGMAALELLDRHRTDVVLLDIRMPGMSGLDTADRINRNWPACRIIFLSGYNDFSSVYAANRKSNTTYLLKTEDDAEIIAAVRNALEQLEEERRQELLMDQARQSERYSQHLLEREVFRRVLSGSSLAETLGRIKWTGRDPDLDVHRPVCLLHARFTCDPAGKASEEIIASGLKVKPLIALALDQRFVVCVTDIAEDTLVLFLQPRPQAEAPVMTGTGYVRECLDTMVLQCAEAVCSLTVLQLYGREIRWDESGMACERMEQRFLTELYAEAATHSFGSVFRAESAPSADSDARAIPSGVPAQLESLARSLNVGDRAAYRMALDALSRQVRGSCGDAGLEAILLFQAVSRMLLEFVERHHLRDKLAGRFSLRGLYNLELHETWQDAFRYADRLSATLFSLLGDEAQHRNDRLVQDIQQYIRNHLGSDLSLTLLSNLVNYSGSYLSRVFNQSAGVSLSTYINSVRIEKAKELLQETNASIQDISTQVGFDSSQYFSIVFRKIVGTTPREYRGLHVPE